MPRTKRVTLVRADEVRARCKDIIKLVRAERKTATTAFQRGVLNGAEATAKRIMEMTP